MENEKLVEGRKRSWWGSRTDLEKWLLGLLLLTFALCVGLIVGMLLTQQKKYRLDPHFQKMKEDLERQEFIQDKLLREISVDNIRDNLHLLTKSVHVAGTPEQLGVMKIVHDTYVNNGLDKVEYTDYDVLLSYPDYDNPNTVALQENDGSWTVLSNGTGEPLGPMEAQKQENRDEKARIWWNAFSKNGTVQGPVVYANFGTEDDFDKLESLGVPVQGRIALIRYGRLYRGSKAVNAWKKGAVGVILYSDPEDYGPPDSFNESFVFPQSIYMPPSGAQRGTLGPIAELQTPFFPAKNYTYRRYSERLLRETGTIPDIPVMPIGYGDAKKIFAELDGDSKSLPDSFKGGIRGIVYRLNGSKLFQMTVRSQMAPNSKIRNVIGYLRGQEEPDRLVLFSNHVDAWTYGSQDPNSATAVLLEMSRAFMKVSNETGWRPRRTLVFCSWDAEEFGLVGSGEFAEEYLKLLESRAVALINVDIAVTGNMTIGVDSVPLLYRVISEAAGKVPNPSKDELASGRDTVLDSWLFHGDQNLTLTRELGLPVMGVPGSGSDQAQFLLYVGVPVVDMDFRCAHKDCYLLYHSMYEVPWTMENLVDPGFVFSKAIGQLWSEVGRNLADSLIVPFNVSDYTYMLSSYIQGLDELLSSNHSDQASFSQLIPNYEQIIAGLKNAGIGLEAIANEFQAKVDQGNSGDSELTLRQIEMLNSRLTSLERCFISPEVLPGHLYPSRHVIFTPSSFDLYGGVTFPGVLDGVKSYRKASNQTERDKALEMVQLGLNAIQYSLESAMLMLATPDFD